MNSYEYGLEILYDSSIYVFDLCFRYMFVLSTVDFVGGGECGEIVLLEDCFFSVYLCLSSLCVLQNQCLQKLK